MDVASGSMVAFFHRDNFGYHEPVVRFEPGRGPIWVNLLIALFFTIVVGLSGLLVQYLTDVDPKRVRMVLRRIPLQMFATLLILWIIHGFIPSASAQEIGGGAGVSPVILGTYALLFFIVVGTSNYLFNNIITSEGDRVHEFIVSHPVIERVVGEGKRLGREKWLILFCLIAYGFVGAYINPSFSMIPTQEIGILLIAIVSILIGAYAKDSVRFLLTRVYKWPSWFKANLAGLFIGVACIALSRSLELSPGYIYGAPMGLFIVSAAYSKREGFFEFIALFSVMAIALIAWLLIPMLAVYEVPTDLVSLLFIIVAEHAFFEMLPLPYLAGGSIFRWRKFLWAIEFLLVVFLLYQTAFNPKGTLVSLMGSPPGLSTLVLLACYAIGAFLLWMYIVWGRKK
jgi:hypothetical protein